MEDKLIKTLNDAGFGVVEGVGAVFQKIEEMSNGDPTLLCSGFGVFPDGTRCQGCSNCHGKYAEQLRVNDQTRAV